MKITAGTGSRKRAAALIAAVMMAAVSTAAAFAAGGMSDMRCNAAEKYVETSEYPALAGLYEDLFRVGVAVQAIDHWNDPTAEIGNPDKEELIRHEFNSMTFGNEFKPAYNFDPESDTLFTVDPAAEELLDWARENSMPVRGHVLVWHSQVNPAIFAKDFKALSGGKLTTQDNAQLDEECLVDRKELLSRLRRYIRGVLEYTYANGYADVIYAWDVVNEAVDESRSDGLRNSLWYQIIGPEFLYYSFLYAREAQIEFSEKYAADYGLDPEKDDLSPIRALLFYNDYNEWFPARVRITRRILTEDVYNADQKMVRSPAISPDGDGTILGDGLIDGIGMQGHLSDNQNIPQYMKALEAYDEAVGLVHITELDVGRTGSGGQADQKQAQFYNSFFLKLAESGVNLTSVTFWGLTDDASWRKGADPLLFRKDLSPKPAFDAVVAAAGGEEYTAVSSAAAGSTAGTNAKSLLIDFEPYKDGGGTKTWTPADAGFYSRGSGHQSTLVLVSKINHTPDAPIGFSLRVRRSEADATVRREINDLVGRHFHVAMYVMTEDKQVTLGLEGNEQKILTTARIKTGDEWTFIEADAEVPADWSSAQLYLESDAAADLYIDDFSLEPEKSEAEETEDSGNMNTAGTSALIPELTFKEVEIPENEAIQLARALKLGWNLGNTMDAFGKNPAKELDAEVSWQPVRTTRQLIHSLHEAGFETLRIPVSWHDHLIDDDFTISGKWLDRVQEIADYALDEGMYVIINVHHDNDEQSRCLFPDKSHLAQSERFITRIWEQVSERFKDYDEHLIFEAMNEPRLIGHKYEWNCNIADEDVKEAVECINILNQDFVDTVRASGGQNTERFLLVPGYCGSPDGVLNSLFKMPDDSAKGRIMIMVHAYTPYDFALNPEGTDQFAADRPADTRDINTAIDRLYKTYVKEGIPVVIDECGSVNRGGNLEARVQHAAYFFGYAWAHGIPCCWWDNGAFDGDDELFGFIDRRTGELTFPEIMEAMLMVTSQK